MHPTYCICQDSKQWTRPPLLVEKVDSGTPLLSGQGAVNPHWISRQWPVDPHWLMTTSRSPRRVALHPSKTSGMRMGQTDNQSGSSAPASQQVFDACVPFSLPLLCLAEDKSSVSASLSDFNVRKSQSDNQWGLNAQPPARGVPISVLRSSVNFPSGAFFRGSQGGAESGAELLAQAPTLAGLALGQGLGPAMRQGSGSRSGSGSAGGAGGRGPGEAQFHSQTLLSSSVRSPLGGDLSSMSSGNSSSDFALPQAGPGSAVGLSPWTTTGSGAGGGAIGGVGIGIGTGVASGAAQWHTRGSVPELSGGASLAAGAMRRSHDVGDIPFRDGLLPSASLRDSHPQPLGSAHHPGDPNHSHNYSNSHSGSHSSSQNARLGPPSIQLQVQPQPSNLRDSTSHSVRDSGGSLGGGLFNKAISLSRAGATAAAAVGAKRSTSPMRRSNHSPLRRTAVGMGSLQPPGKDSLSRGTPYRLVQFSTLYGIPSSLQKDKGQRRAQRGLAAGNIMLQHGPSCAMT